VSPFVEISSMKYLYAYQYIFESPKWMANVLAATICLLVPVVGPMVLLGYAFDVIESLHRRRESRYPDFDTNRLSEYLLRGVWPWLVYLIVSSPLVLVVVLLYFGVFVGTILAPDNARVLVLVVLVLLFLIVLVALSLLVSLIAQPLILRAGLTQDFSQAFSMPFAKDFIKRTWRETILVLLFLLASNLLVGLAGTLLCIVGVYPLSAIYCLASNHLAYQLYELYLQRGGTPIPLKADSAPEGDLPLVYEAPPSQDIKPAEEP
jgi:hypothetical protein